LEILLVIGSTGLVGSKILRLAHDFEFEVYGTGKTRQYDIPRFQKLDVTDRGATLKLVSRIDPDVIINTAALTDVDYCETHKEEAEKVNVGGAENLAEASEAINCRLVHVSTDSVFDGNRGHYSEADIPNPINEYSSTKLRSERVVSKLSSFAIARPSVVYGWHTQTTSSPATKKMNFAMFLLDRLSKKATVKAVQDQYSSPTLADNLAEVLLMLGKIRENGVFHTAGRSCLSRYEFATMVCRVFGYQSDLVQPVLSTELNQEARRPKNCCLEVAKAEAILGIKFLTAIEGVTRMKEQSNSRR